LKDTGQSRDQPSFPDGKARSFRLLGVRVDDIDQSLLIEMILQAILRKERMVVVNANVQLINLVRRNAWLVKLFDQADIAFCDGAGVQFALWLETGHKPARHTPPQWIMPLSDRLAQHDATVFWLGGKPEVVLDAARALEAKTGVRAVGTQHGYFDHTYGSPENEGVVAEINRVRPDLLLLNMGMPLQEKWLYENWHRLDVRVAITAGALVDHVAGRVKRPPLWVAECGLEWLVRLAIEPGRLWRRYLFGLPVFAIRLMWSLVRAGVYGRRSSGVAKGHAEVS
jgi:N-acetylglucosaminyldiphosphoundecaprenol N-acetyl-beta-D-mannosaminyltransferase